MTVFVALVLTVLTFAFIVYPLFRRRPQPVDAAEDETLQELYSRRDTTYSMLKELEFDLQSGILSEEDYRELEKRYERRAISILRDIDNTGKGVTLEDEIERQVLELRRTGGQSCPKCGTSFQQGDRFCSQCGASLARGGAG